MDNSWIDYFLDWVEEDVEVLDFAGHEIPDRLHDLLEDAWKYRALSS